MAKIKISVHFSFAIFACVLVYFGKGFLLLNYVATILLHEFAHAIVARNLGYNIKNMKLTPFGICLNLNSSQILPEDEVKIAIAGPMLNLAISIVLFSMWWIFPSSYNGTYLFCYANLVTCLFNLLPAFPLDGGRVFRAILRQKMGDKKAFKICKTTNIILSIFFVFLFVCSIFVKVNFTYLLVLLSFLPSKDKNQNYTFINYSLIKKRKKCLKIKNIYILETEPLYKACKHIDSFSYLNLYVYSLSGTLRTILGESQLLLLTDMYPASTSLKDTKILLKGNF